MRRVNEQRWLPAIALAAAFLLFQQAASPQSATESGAAGEQPRRVIDIPTPPPTPEEVGDAWMLHRGYQAAIDSYKKAPANSADVLNKMGIAYQMMFNADEATRCYEASLKINPRVPNVYNNLGTVYDSLSRYRKAESMYRQALNLDPHSALVLKNLGSNLLAQHRFKEGWESYKAALALDPKIFFKQSPAVVHFATQASVEDRGAINYYMAKGCLRAGMPDRAIDYLRRAMIEGFINRKKIIADGEFAKLQGVPAFDRLLDEQGNP